MKAIDVISRTIGAQPDQDSIRWIDSTHMKQYRVLSIAGLTGCFVCLFGPMAALPIWLQLLGLGVGIVCIVLRTTARKRFEYGIASTLDMKCDPVLYCRWVLAFLAAGRPGGDHVRGVWNYAYGLMWQGRWHEAIKLARTLEADMTDPGVAFAYDSFMADCAFALRDPDKLSSYIQALKRIPDRRVVKEAAEHAADVAFAYDSFMADCAFALRDPDKLSSYIQALKRIPDRRVVKEAAEHAAELEPLHDLLTLERDGRLDEARAIVERILADPGLLPIERLLATLHKAECTTDASERRRLLDTVIETGGTTWCVARARELKARLSADQAYAHETEVAR